MAFFDLLPFGVKLGASIFILLVVAIMVIKSRYKIFTNREFVLFFRRGKIVREGYGGGYFLLPFIDELIVLSTTVQNLQVDAGEVITKENQDVRVNGFVVWRIESPREAYSSITGSGSSVHVMDEINKVLARLVESIVRTTVARLNLDQVLRERGLIIDAIMSELVSVVGPMGIKINTAEIRHVEVVDQQLFNDLQEKYRQEARLNAETIRIKTNQDILKAQAFKDQQVRLFQAEQEEAANVRELAKDRNILLEQQKLNEADQRRMKVVQELEKQRETSVAEIEQKKLKVEAETKLMQIELEAESRKRKTVLENIEVEAQQKKLMAEAEADAIRVRAVAEREAIEMQAQAEAYRLESVADARKKSMLAEAEGKKAILLAEAEGLREKVQAQGLINEAMIMQNLVEQLPAIASSIKVGDINWLNMEGKNGESPLGIIPKNMLQLMTLSKSFGLDIEKLIASLRGKKSNGQSLLSEIAPMIDDSMLKNADPVMDGEMIVGLDLDHDGIAELNIPEHLRAETLEEVLEKVKQNA